MQLVEETVEQMPGYAAEPMSSNIHPACCGMFNSNVRMGIKDWYLRVSNSTQYSVWILTGKGLSITMQAGETK